MVDTELTIIDALVEWGLSKDVEGCFNDEDKRCALELDMLVVFEIFAGLVLLNNPERIDEDETIFKVLMDDRGEIDETLCCEVLDEVALAPTPSSTERKQRYAKISCILIDLSRPIQWSYIARRDAINR